MKKIIKKHHQTFHFNLLWQSYICNFYHSCYEILQRL